jgi:ribosome modulation factor
MTDGYDAAAEAAYLDKLAGEPEPPFPCECCGAPGGCSRPATIAECELAEEQGRDAYHTGGDRSDCPYVLGETRRAWFNAFNEEGIADHGEDWE